MNTEQQNQQNFDSLMRLIRRAVKAGKFALCFANCSSLTEQNRYMEELCQRCGQEEIALVDVSLWNRGTIGNLRPVVHEILKTKFPDGELPTKSAIQVSGLEVSILLDPDEQFPAVLQSMNMGREGFIQDFPCPFLLWLPDYAYTKLIHVAPDFWSVRYGSFEFCSDKDTEQAYDLDQLSTEKQNRTLWRDKQDQIPLIERILETHDRQTTPQVDTDLRLKLADAYRFLGKTERARQNYEEALRVSQELEDLEREGAALNGLGLVYTETGEYAKAIGYFERYLDLRRQQGKEQAQAIGYNHLGLVYDKQGNSEQAINSYQQALIFAQESHTRGDVLGNLGLVYRKLEKFKEALEYHQQALRISQDVNDPQSIIRDSGNMGLVYHELKDYEKAIYHYNQALQLSQQKEYKRDELDQYFNLGDAYRDLGYREQAKFYYSKTRELSKQIGDEKLELLALEKLCDLHGSEEFHDPEQETFWTEQFIERSEHSENSEYQLHCVEKIIVNSHREHLNKHTKQDWLFTAEAIIQKLLIKQQSISKQIIYYEKLIDIYTGLEQRSKIEECQYKLNELKNSWGINIWLTPDIVEVENDQPILQIQQSYTFQIQIGPPITEYSWICHRTFGFPKPKELLSMARREGLKVSTEMIEMISFNIPESQFFLPYAGINMSDSSKELPESHAKISNPMDMGQRQRKDSGRNALLRLKPQVMGSLERTFTFEFQGEDISFDASQKTLSIGESEYSDILYFTITPQKLGEYRFTIEISTNDHTFQDRFDIPLRIVSMLDIRKKLLEKLTRILEISKALSSTLNLDELLDLVTKTDCELTNARGCILRLLNKEGNLLEIKSSYGEVEFAAELVSCRIGESIAGIVAEKKEPVCINEMTSEISKAEAIASMLYSVVCIPIIGKEGVIGTIMAFDKNPEGENHLFTEEDVNIMMSFAGYAAVAIEHARFYERMEELALDNLLRLRELSILYHINIAMRSTVKLSKLLRIILTGVTIGGGLGFNRAMLLMVDERTQTLKGKLGVGPGSGEEARQIWQSNVNRQKSLVELITEVPDEGEYEETSFEKLAKSIWVPLAPDQGLFARTVLEKRAFNILDADQRLEDCHTIANLLETTRFATVPLIFREKVIGVIYVDNKYNNVPISEDDMNFLQMFANQAALAIDNAMLYANLEKRNRELREAQDQLVVQVEEFTALGKKEEKSLHLDTHPTIFLADVTDDLYVIREELKRYLIQAHFRVLPETYYSYEPEAFQKSTSEDIIQSDVFIQLLGPLPGKRPSELPQGYIRCQYEIARELAKPILQWRSPALDIETVQDASQRDFLQLETILAIDIEEFKSKILKREFLN